MPKMGDHRLVTSSYADAAKQYASVVNAEYDELNRPVAASLTVTDAGKKDTTLYHYVYSAAGDLVRKVTYSTANHFSDTVDYSYDDAFLSVNAMVTFKSAVLGRDYYLVNYQNQLRQASLGNELPGDYFLTTAINEKFNDLHSFLGSKPVTKIYSHGNGHNAANAYESTLSTFVNAYKPNNYIDHINVANDGAPYLTLQFRYK